MLIDTIKKKKGVLKHVARDLNVHPSTLLKRLKQDPELWQLVEEERNAFSESLLDNAEETIDFAMSLKEADLDKALKASFFTLNSKGESRGWKNTNSNNSSQTFVFKEIDPTKHSDDTA